MRSLLSHRKVVFAALLVAGLLAANLPPAEPSPAQAQSAPHSLAFDGAGAAEVVPSADLNLTNDWTVELWLKDADPNGFDHAFRYLINKGDGVSTESPFYLLLGNGNLLAGLRTGGTN